MISVVSARRFAAHLIQRPVASASGAKAPHVTQLLRLMAHERHWPNSVLVYESSRRNQSRSTCFDMRVTNGRHHIDPYPARTHYFSVFCPPRQADFRRSAPAGPLRVFLPLGE